MLDTSDNQEVDLPMVVLMNGSTAAGGELFGRCIRVFDKGRLVGTTTAGKGTIQCEPVTMSDGSAVAFTVGILLDQNGKALTAPAWRRM